MDVLTGQFIKKIYGNSNGKYHVYQFSYKNKKCIATLNSETVPDLIGVYVLDGRWITHPTYGPQFEISKLNRYKTDQERGNDYIKTLRGMLVV